ncbi:FlgO family outer membrane protein [Psychrobium sp. 1_MG-2023]|uniref:FlgO family outer membrane protein n=1 Tax=Psychrobium sp. 1_MG-2023 TaxID=3062624 RepID=UPI000C334211|nr:FlgO family outer membrane protein [Psychrobium sp. 1_MG-2023]MDP2559902.1 FlgO family outer membrane protein [Psychrobium sp. 1_MG-2023]PKF58997.1 hypothetical protein CW748_02070 [Alteromonadales bacterium alter-6D02]
MKKYSLLLTLFLGGCSVINSPFQEVAGKDSQQMIEKKQAERAEHSVSYYDAPLIKNVNHYSKWVVQDLLTDFDMPDNRAVFAVADFALLDSGLRTTNHFGRQLTEAIMHQINRAGYSVIDIKSSSSLKLNEQGDLFFQTEVPDELSDDIAATYIANGTMTRHRGGYILNARVVDVESNALVSSAQIFVPHDVVDSVLLEGHVPQAVNPTTGEGEPEAPPLPAPNRIAITEADTQE